MNERDRKPKASGYEVRTWSDWEVRQIKAMLDQGETVGDICRRFECSQMQLYWLRKRRGWEIEESRDPDRLRAGVAELSRDGRSDGEVARALGCSRASVCEYRKRLGIPAQRKRGKQPASTFGVLIPSPS